MSSDFPKLSRQVLNKNLCDSLYHVTLVLDRVTTGMSYDGDHECWQRTFIGHDFNAPQMTFTQLNSDSAKNVLNVVSTWINAHEEAQVMLASVLVVIGIWWMVRTLLSLLVNIVFPLIVIVLAIVCVPQLRVPLIGQNYPAIATMLRNLLIKMAEKLQT